MKKIFWAVIGTCWYLRGQSGSYGWVRMNLCIDTLMIFSKKE